MKRLCVMSFQRSFNSSLLRIIGHSLFKQKSKINYYVAHSKGGAMSTTLCRHRRSIASRCHPSTPQTIAYKLFVFKCDRIGIISHSLISISTSSPNISIKSESSPSAVFTGLLYSWTIPSISSSAPSVSSSLSPLSPPGEHSSSF